MKKVLNILLNAFIALLAFLCALVSIVIIILEARLLFSGDWLLYQSPISGFIRYLFRFILSLFALASFVIEIIYIFKKIDILKSLLRASNISLFIFLFMFAVMNANFEGILLFFLYLFLLLFKLLKSGLVIIPRYIAAKKEKANQIEEINIHTDEQN